jgi:hypothetical protein
MGFSPGPWVHGIRIDRFETPFQPASGSFIAAMVKQSSGKQLIRRIFIDRFWTPFQPASGSFIAAMVKQLNGEAVDSKNIWW